MSDEEAPVGEVVELESGIEPLWMIVINILSQTAHHPWGGVLFDLSQN